MQVGAARHHLISFYPLSGRLTHFVHMPPTFTSSNPLTGRTDRLHIFQTFVPSHSEGTGVYLEPRATPEKE